MRPVFADPSGRRRVLARRIAISAGATAGYGVLLLVAFSGVPDLPAALEPRPLPTPQATSPPPVAPPPVTPPPAIPPPATTTDESRTPSPSESQEAPEPVGETPRTSARPVPVRTADPPTPPGPREPAGSPPSGGDRRNGRAPGDPPGKAKTAPPKSGH
ncbi:hypothetical protein SAMN04489729_2088 [Amycolatopsis lurida]|uniref:hypothetical protein n=1 Tax=Amycolatopsis lurida TaxID=31959 RepID=UPI000897701B|nr:hypothetical protein [Amycolatopsis lurida]SEC64913.1 hypothetical protein SAMN04489729_2088 [Amycolatopsis lurida]